MKACDEGADVIVGALRLIGVSGDMAAASWNGTASGAVEVAIVIIENVF